MDIKEGPIYFDTNVFIYSIEGHEKYYAWLQKLFNYVYAQKILIITSELTLAECLVKPVKEGNTVAIDAFKTHIKSNDAMAVKHVSREILIRSATVRSEMGLKLPDAIHMATAMSQSCKTFVTNDKKLISPEGIDRVYLSDAVISLTLTQQSRPSHPLCDLNQLLRL